MKVFYFTGTGNSLAVAKKISSSFRKVELLSIPRVIKKDDLEYNDEVIGFVFPTYNSNLPKVVREFLGKVKLKAKYIFAIATYGNKFSRGGDGNVTQEFNKLAEKYGYKVNYLNSILMVDNFLDLFEVDEEKAKIPSKEIDKNLDIIINDLKEKKDYHKKGGIFGTVATVICKPLVHIQDKGLAGKDYLVDKKCNGCATCLKVCPAGNITIEEGKPKFSNKCYKCYACIHNCPKNALHLRNEKSSKRWRNENVTLKDIIDANNQNRDTF